MAIKKQKVPTGYKNYKSYIQDSERSALPPGKRNAKKSGKTYYESRLNRSDKNQTGKGRLLRIGELGKHYKNMLIQLLGQKMALYTLANKREKNVLKKEIIILKKKIKSL